MEQGREALDQVRNRKTERLGWAALCEVWFALGLFLLIYGIVHGETDPKRNVLVYEGPYQEYKIINRWRSTVRRFTIGGQVFTLESVGLPAFDGAFVSQVQPGETVYVSYWDKEGAAADAPRTLMGLRTDGKVYMAPEDALAAHMGNNRLSAVTGAVFLAVGTGILLYLLETKHHALRYAARTRRHRGKWRK